jgi:endonuclease VIII
MPEGDTIFRAARTLHRALAGHVVTRFDTAYALLARVHDDTPITGRTIEAVEAHGKHMVMRFSGDVTKPDDALSRAASGGPVSARLQLADAGRVGGAWRGPLALRTHMRMHGSWHIYRPGERWQRPAREMRVLVGTADFVAVGFNVPDAEFERAGDVGARDPIARLGPDLLRPEFDAVEAIRRLRERTGVPIAEALLDQRALAGIGNVFKSEVLFESGVHPRTPVDGVSDDRLRALVDTARRQLAANVGEARPQSGRRTTGRMALNEGLWVYGRGGRPCRRCGTPIAFARQGGGARPTYWCPRCQPDPAPAP